MATRPRSTKNPLIVEVPSTIGKRSRGRPTTYSDLYPEQARRVFLLKRQATDEDLATHFGVSSKTIVEWKKAHPLFRDAIALGKETADLDLINAMFKRALGMTIKKEVALKVKEDGVTEKIKKVTITEEIPPDFASGSWLLRNRRPNEWKANPEESGRLGEPLGAITVSIQDPSKPKEAS